MVDPSSPTLKIVGERFRGGPQIASGTVDLGYMFANNLAKWGLLVPVFVAERKQDGNFAFYLVVERAR